MNNTPISIYLVDTNPQSLDQIRHCLQTADSPIRIAPIPEGADVIGIDIDGQKGMKPAQHCISAGGAPVILFSSRCDAPLQQRAREIGAYACMPKTAQLATLSELITMAYSLFTAQKKDTVRDSNCREIMHSLEEAVIKVNKDGKIQFANPAAAKLCGYRNPHEIEGKKIEGFYESPVLRNRVLERLKKEEVLHNFSFPLRCKDGSIRKTTSNVRAILDSKGAIQASIGTFRSTDEEDRLKIELEKRLREQQCLYRCSMILLRRSIAVQALMKQLEELIPQGFYDPEHTDITIHLDAESRQSDYTSPIKMKEVRYGSIDVMIQNSSSNTILEEEKQMVDTIANLIAQTVLEFQQYSAMRKSQSQLQKMFDNHKVVMLLIDPDSGRIIKANKAAVYYYGYSLDEFSELYIQDINQLPPEQVREERLRAQEENRNYFRFPHKLKNGEIRPVEVYSNPIEYDDKHVLFSLIHDISEKEDAKKLLSDSRVRLELATRASGVGIWDWDLRTNSVYLNKEWKGMLGFDEHELEPGTIELWKEMLHPDDRDWVLSELDEYLQGKREEYSSEHRIRNKRGSWTWISDHGKAIEFSGDNRPLRMLGTHIDITEQKKKNIFVEGVARFSREMESCMDINLLLQRAGETIEQAFDLEEKLSISIRLGAQEYKHGASYGEAPSLRIPLSQKEHRIGEIQIFADQQELNILSSFIKTFSGRIVRTVERIEAEKALAKQKELYRITIQSIGDGIISTDTEGKIILVNHVAELLLRRDPGTLEGESIYTQMQLIDAASNERRRHPVEEALKRNTTVGLQNHTILKRIDDSEIYIADSASPIRDGDGRNIGAVMVFRDESLRYSYEKQLRESIEEKELLLREVQHRIKNDLSLVQALLQIQASQSEEEGTQRALEDAGKRVSVISKLYQNLYRNEDLQDADLSNLVKQVIHGHMNSQSKLRLNLPEKPVYVAIATAATIGIIINELLTNMEKYAFPVSKNRDADISLQHLESGDLFIHIRDHGPGFPKELVDEKKAIGFGTNLIFLLVRQEHGSVEFINSDTGSEVRLSFPRGKTVS